MGLSNELSCEAGSFSLHCNPHRFLQWEVLRLSFPMLGSWVVQSVSFPSCSSLFISMWMWDHPLHQLPSCWPGLLPLHPSCPSPPLLPVWYFLTPWLSDFHTVQFSGSSGCFCFWICCWPSFGCGRKQSISTYASILARSLFMGNFHVVFCELIYSCLFTIFSILVLLNASHFRGVFLNT